MASRKEQKERLREERLERERAAQASERRRRLVGYAVGGVLAGAAVAAIVIVIVAGGGDDGGKAGGFPEGSRPPDQRVTNLSAASRGAGCELRTLRSEGRDHVDGPVTYRSNPPTTGQHAQVPADDAAYTEPPPSENLVHSLEHGRVIVWFRPSAPDKVKGDLKALYDEDPFQMLLTPGPPNMPFEVAASAWGREPEPNGRGYLLGCPRMNPKVFDALRAFKEEHRGNGPEAVP